ncbi:MAG TPA: hypothetical protein VGJ10_19445, partial [Paraburkholderia sp.]
MAALLSSFDPVARGVGNSPFQLAGSPSRRINSGFNHAEAAEAAQIAHDQPAIGSLELIRVKPDEVQRNPLAAGLRVWCSSNFWRLGTIHYDTHVLQGADLHFVQVDDRPVDDHPSGLTSHVLASSAAPIAALRLAEPLETRVGRA